MKHSILCAAIAFLTPFLSASTANSSQHEPNQHECSSSHENVQSFLLNGLPPELRTLVFQHVPLSYLVCREWEEKTRVHRALKLKVFLDKAMHFETIFNSDKVGNEAGYVERHFSTLGGMHRMLSRIIASFYEKTVESAKVEGRKTVELNSLESFVNQRIEAFLEENQLISKLSDSLLRLEDVEGPLFDVHSGNGSFCELPLKVRQFVAKNSWKLDIHKEGFYQLSSFLSSFHDKFDVFKDSLVDINPRIVARACIEIVLGTNCTILSVDDRRILLDSIKLLFSDDPFVQETYSFCVKLTPNSSISEILRAMIGYPLVKGIAFRMLQFSSSYVTAIWCMKDSREPYVPTLYSKAPKYWLFSKSFLIRHGLLGKQAELLKKCNANSLLWNLPPDLTGLDIQALVKWANHDVNRKKIFSFDSLVILYSLDDGNDLIKKYSAQLLLFKEELNDLLVISQIALGIKFGRYLNSNKKLALLQLLYPEHFDKVAIYLDGDRKKLLFQLASLFENENYASFVHDYLSESDLSLLVEACLETSKSCNVRPLGFRNKKLAVQALLKYIGNDVEKVTGLHHLSEYYQAMVFLLTDHDEIANSLIKSECFKHLDWDRYFVKTCLDWKALRAAKRIHKYRTMESQQN